MGVASALEIILGTSMDLRGAEEGFKKLEEKAEETANKVGGKFGLMALGIATAITGTVLVAMEKAIKTTAEWGLEMEHLGNQMGMTSTEAATLVGMFERFGISGQTASRSMQVMAMQVKATQEALDPFNTRMGQLLGTLRDSSGQALNMGQVLDLVRQKIAGAGTDTEKLQIAQSLLGTRIGGRVVGALKSSNEEWAKLKASVEAAQGPVEQAAERALAYKQASSELEQTLRGVQVTLGTKLLPTITDTIKSVTEIVKWFSEWKNTGIGQAIIAALGPLSQMRAAFDGVTAAVVKSAEMLHLVDKGTYDAFKHMDEYRAAAEKAALEDEKAATAEEQRANHLRETERLEQQLANLRREQVQLAEKGRALGLNSEEQVKQEVEAALARLEEQKRLLTTQLNAPGLTAESRLDQETKLAKVRIEAAELVARAAEDQYKNEELQIRANGALSLSKEIELLGKKLSDERIVGDERLKLEGEIYEKRRQYTEQAVAIGRQLGIVSAQQEIDYRKQLAAEKLGQGDALGAAQEIVKARDLAIKQADQTLEFTKKIQTVSLQSEIEYQKQKLELVRGNAEQEKEIIGQIATLDKQLYDKRLEYALNYTQNAINAYRALMKATGQQDTETAGKGESQTFAEAQRDAERARRDQTRTLRDIAAHGGTEEARNLGTQQSQAILKDYETAVQLGKHISDDMKDAADAARDFLKAASGGEEVRAPGGPNPVAASLLSPEESSSTAGLNRGSDIPRLDTSYTDLAIRVRDVLLGTVPNVQNFSNAVADATRKISSVTGFQSNPGAVGPQGGVTTLPTQGSPPFGNDISTPAAAPTSGPGQQQPLQPSSQVGVGGLSTGLSTLSDKLDQLIDAVNGVKDSNTNFQDQNAANAESLVAAIQQTVLSRPTDTRVQVSVDPNSGDFFVQSIVKDLQ